MIRSLSFGALVALALASSAALASPQIPTPANPYPDEPVATDGTPLAPGIGRKQNGFNAVFPDERAATAGRR